ncbi:MAG: GTP-binding protein [Thaumarchaeota archaeon]|nr:GTP-binding protein [Candidatus Calditenuaceae archaeon]MDW8042750.1 GTP-binding protein [Nitrososphaerota archaeon]
MGSRVSLPPSEEGHIEFKSRLLSSVHLRPERRQQLVAQMKSRLIEGGGVAVYVLGVEDDGTPAGLTEVELEESVAVISSLAAECGARVRRVERASTEGGIVAKVVIERVSTSPKSHLTVGVAGHVNHGKSTLVACLVTGERDDGTKWLYMDTLPHEISRNLSADLHFTVLGFREGRPVFLRNPRDREEKARVVREAERVVSIVDTVGHEPWLRTTIRGLLGQGLDYGILVVAADDGPTYITREHLGVMFGSQLPVIVCITKVDKVGRKRLEEVREEVSRLIKRVGRVPYQVKDRSDVDVVVDKVNPVVPIVEVSSATRQGFDLLYGLLSSLPPRPKRVNGPFLMYVDRVYNVEGAGTVVSGTILQGTLRSGDALLLGPDDKGSFAEVRVRSIEVHHSKVEEAYAGQLVGVAIRGVPQGSVRRGMVLSGSETRPRAVRRFDGEFVVLNHPTRVATGYEPIFHCHTIAQSVKTFVHENGFVAPGEQGTATFSFKYRPEFVREDDVFVLREGRVKGIGRITRVLEDS